MLASTIRSLTLIGLISSSVLAVARPEPNAFLNKPAHSKEALIEQVRTDPDVLTRYRRHFGLPKDELTRQFNTLRLVKLSEKQQFVVYNADKKNNIRSKVFSLPKGALVYVDERGVPVLKKSCGNALSKSIGGGVPVPTSPTTITQARLQELHTFAQVPAAPEPLELLVAAEIANPPFEPEAVFEPTLFAPDEPVVIERPVVGGGGGYPPGGELMALLPLPLFFPTTFVPDMPKREVPPSSIPGPGAAPVFALILWRMIRKR
jgi:hypothetical protein